MRNYLEEIEKEYSQIRGKWSPLSPIDWNLAASWEKKGIPLHIVLAAMGDAHLKFIARKSPGTINTLRYFEQAVETRFSAYLESQVGKCQIGIDPALSDGDHTVETFICLRCRHYENNTPEDFYKGWCSNGDLWQDTNRDDNPHIFDARDICNPEGENEFPHSYKFFEQLA